MLFANSLFGGAIVAECPHRRLGYARNLRTVFFLLEMTDA